MTDHIITARERNPFGEIDPNKNRDESKFQKDAYWLPGYSDKRAERDLIISRNNVLNERKKVPTLSHRFEIVSALDLKGQSNVRAITDFRGKGYRPVKWEEAKSLGVNFDGTNYTKATDGTVTFNGEGLLMVCDQQTAARNYADFEKRNDAALEAPRSKMQDAIDRFNSTNDLDAKTGAQIIDVDDTGKDAKRP